MAAFDNLLAFLGIAADKFSVKEKSCLNVVAGKNGQDMSETFGTVQGIKNERNFFPLPGGFDRVFIHRIRFSHACKISDVKGIVIKLVVRPPCVNPVMGILNGIDIDLGLFHKFKGSP